MAHAERKLYTCYLYITTLQSRVNNILIIQNCTQLPGSSKETCDLIAKACIVGVLHDSHQLNTVVTCKQSKEGHSKNILIRLKSSLLEYCDLTLSNLLKHSDITHG